MPTLHIHFDEAGDWNFNPKGSRYYILTAAWTYEPRALADALTRLRFSLLRDGVNLEAFHASPDKQTTRNAVVAALASVEGWSFHSVVIEKRKVNPTLREPAKFYPKFAGILLRFILRGRAQKGSTRALIYTDTLPINTNAKREGVLKAIHTTCAEEMGDGCTHYVFSHCHQSNKWIQIADYCCWAVQKKWNGNDVRTYDSLAARRATAELEVTSWGDGTTYY